MDLLKCCTSTSGSVIVAIVLGFFGILRRTEELEIPPEISKEVNQKEKNRGNK
jgi:hypothetical protein